MKDANLGAAVRKSTDAESKSPKEGVKEKKAKAERVEASAGETRKVSGKSQESKITHTSVSIPYFEPRMAWTSVLHELCLYKRQLRVMILHLWLLGSCGTLFSFKAHRDACRPQARVKIRPTSEAQVRVLHDLFLGGLVHSRLLVSPRIQKVIFSHCAMCCAESGAMDCASTTRAKPVPRESG